ncbi:hypothetical protein BV898_06728 [Hypsibius exemplaris]|uniref:Uncharacterized protein n=1 Tax=Hypsibius exemplaris TaxID=2072580 RepID=A0A1W0WVV1_HYPEX|nr:hypothetical protein BV898_06728 [Hypsibius exemplaris]
MKSYWEEPAGPPSWELPVYPPSGMSSLGEGTSKTRSKVVHIHDPDLAAERQKMLLPVQLDSTQDAFFRASIQLACCDPTPVVTISAGVHESSAVWSIVSGVGGRINGLASDYLPGFRQVSDNTTHFYQWIRRFPIPGSFRTAGATEDRNERVKYLDKSAVRALSWHPSQLTLAFADGLGSVIICSCDKSYPLENGVFSRTLKHEYQKNAVSVVWDSFCDFRLGVCCSEAIIVWDLNPKTVNGMQTPLMTIQHLQLGEDVFTDMLFTSNLGFIASSLHGKLREYDLFSPETEQFLSYQGITELTLSPDHVYIGYSDSNGFVGAMKEDGFDSVFHLHVGLLASALTWLPDSTGLLFAKQKSTELFSVSIRPPPTPPGMPPSLHTVNPVGKFVGGGEDEFTRGSNALVEIRSVKFDSTGQRLVILLQNRQTKATRCVLCWTKLDGEGGLTLIRITGWIVLAKNDVPILADFALKSSLRGGILSVGSRGGVISHFPVCFHTGSNISPTEQTFTSPSNFHSHSQRSLFTHILSCLAGPVYQWLTRLFSAGGSHYESGFSSDVANMSANWSARPRLPPAATRITSFVESKPHKPIPEYRQSGDILSRSLSPSPEMESSRSPSSERYSDHHMSVDRTPDPPTKVGSSSFSPLAAQLAALGMGSGRQSSHETPSTPHPLVKTTNAASNRESDVGMALPSRLKFSE